MLCNVLCTGGKAHATIAHFTKHGSVFDGQIGTSFPTSGRTSQILEQRDDIRSRSDKREQSGVGCLGCEDLFLDEEFIVFFFWDEEVFFA